MCAVASREPTSTQLAVPLLAVADIDQDIPSSTEYRDEFGVPTIDALRNVGAYPFVKFLVGRPFEKLSLPGEQFEEVCDHRVERVALLGFGLIHSLCGPCFRPDGGDETTPASHS